MRRFLGKGVRPPPLENHKAIRCLSNTGSPDKSQSYQASIQCVCVVSLSKTRYPLLSTGSFQEDRPDMTDNLLTWDVESQIKHTNQTKQSTGTQKLRQVGAHKVVRA